MKARLFTYGKRSPHITDLSFDPKQTSDCGPKFVFSPQLRRRDASTGKLNYQLVFGCFWNICRVDVWPKAAIVDCFSWLIGLELLTSDIVWIAALRKLSGCQQWSNGQHMVLIYHKSQPQQMSKQRFWSKPRHLGSNILSGSRVKMNNTVNLLKSMVSNKAAPDWPKSVSETWRVTGALICQSKAADRSGRSLWKLTTTSTAERVWELLLGFRKEKTNIKFDWSVLNSVIIKK